MIWYNYKCVHIHIPRTGGSSIIKMLGIPPGKDFIEMRRGEQREERGGRGGYDGRWEMEKVDFYF